MIYATTCINLKILSSERSHILHDSFIWNVQERHIYRDTKQISAFQGLWEGVEVNCLQGQEENCHSEGNVLKLDHGNACITL